LSVSVRRRKEADRQGAAQWPPDDAHGFSIGGGAELQFLPKWSVKAEYLSFNLGSMTPGVPFNYKSAGVPAVMTAHSNARSDGSIVRFGVNHRIKCGGALKVFNLDKIDQLVD